MTGRQFILLLTLAAIWGASFLFMRVSAGALGPVLLIESRVVLAAVFLLLVALLTRRQLKIRGHIRHYFILGLVNSALPFLLYAYAAQVLTASLMSVLNATTPLWGALVARICYGQRLSAKQLSGLASGIIGVSILVGFDPQMLSTDNQIAALAVLGATFCYGLASNYSHRYTAVGSFNNAHGSMWSSTILILPLLLFMPAHIETNFEITTSVVLLGVLCTGVAYLLYFRLIDETGPASALTVTFLIPVFGIIWGILFLNEKLSWQMLSGTLIVLIGTSLSTGFSPLRLLTKQLSTSNKA